MWGLIGPADVGEHAGEGEVVDVVVGPGGHRSGLTPPCHPPVDKTRVRCAQHVRSDAEAFGDTRPETLDEGVGPGGQATHQRNTIGVLQIDAGRQSTPRQQIPLGQVLIHSNGLRRRSFSRTLGAEDLSAEISQDHRAERRRAEPTDLDDLDARQRTGHVLTLLSRALR